MSDLIDRQTAIDAVNSLTYPSSLMDVKRELIELPPAEPKRGKWILVTDNNGQHFECNRCGEWRYHQEQKFCGECGADMREDCEKE